MFRGSILNVRSSGLGKLQKMSKRTIGKRVAKRTTHAANVLKYEGKSISRKSRTAAISKAKKSKVYQGIESGIIKHDKALKVASKIGNARKAEKKLRGEYNSLSKPKKAKYNKWGDRIS
jgi:CRISPR/Cas system-associated protein Cas10 (large subunit of type III CRISPR-Cas system)